MTLMTRVWRTKGYYANFKAFRRVVAKAAKDEVVPPLVKLHNTTVRGWREKPTFVATTATTTRGISTQVTAEGRPASIWYILNFGVPGRTITPSPNRKIRPKKKEARKRGAREPVTKNAGRVKRETGRATRDTGRKGTHCSIAKECKPKRAKGRRTALAFYGGYRPSTRPGRLRGGTSNRSGNRFVRSSVPWPGIAPRGFTTTIADIFRPEYQRIMYNAVRRGARAAQVEGSPAAVIV